MNFSASGNVAKKGQTVWKRNANTTNTNRKNMKGNRVRLVSESSDFLNFCEGEGDNVKINAMFAKKDKGERDEWSQLGRKTNNQKDQWREVKSLAKYSTIASRLQLKRTVPVSTLSKSPGQQKQKKSISSITQSRFTKIIDQNGNISKSFRQVDELRRINPHITKDVMKVKQKVFRMYEKQKREFEGFLTIEDRRRVGSAVGQDMNRISERQQEESKGNTTRMLKEGKGGTDGVGDSVMGQNNGGVNGNKIRRELQLQSNKYCEIQQSNPPRYYKPKPNPPACSSFILNQSQTSYIASNPHPRTTPSSSLPSHQNPNLLKGLLGQYSTYQKLSKHELIQKLISLQYLAQSIFKKNKYLEQQLSKKGNGNQQGRRICDEKSIQGERQDEKRVMRKNRSRELFGVDNSDGYFNQFLEEQRGGFQNIVTQYQNNGQEPYAKEQQVQRFREDQER